MTRVVLGVMAAALVPATALAQAPAPPPPPAPAPAAPPPAAPPPAAAAPAPEAVAPPPLEAAPPAPPPEPVPAAPPPPPPAEEVVPQAPPLPPAAEEEKAEDPFKITTGVGFRGAVRFQAADDPEAFDDVWLDELNVEVRFSGKVTDVVGWTANLTVDGRTNTSAADGPGPIKFQAQALDLVGQLDFADEFHVWLGRMLTPTDRSNFSGAWFMSPWNYPGLYPDAYIGPRGTEEVGREVGAVVWGNDKSGKFKYYAGVMDLDNPELSPLYVARLNFAAIGDEPGFYGSSTYYGTKDIVAIGAAVQYQNQSTAVDDAETEEDERDEELFGFNADLLGEFTIPNAGTLTGEVGYYHFDGPVFAAEDAYYALASYLTPEPIGIGKIQVLGRIQQTMEPDRTAIEGVLSYVMKDYFAKLALSFTHFTNADDSKANLLQLGFQIQQ